MFGIGLPELILLLVLALVILGPEKLPEIARMLGKVLNEVRRATEEVRVSIRKEVDQVRGEMKEEEIRAGEKGKGGSTEGEKNGRG